MKKELLILLFFQSILVCLWGQKFDAREINILDTSQAASLKRWIHSATFSLQRLLA